MSPVVTKGESVSLHVQAKEQDRCLHLRDCRRKTRDLSGGIMKPVLRVPPDVLCIPGSTFVTQSSPTLVPFSTVGKVSSTSGPP